MEFVGNFSNYINDTGINCILDGTGVLKLMLEKYNTMLITCSILLVIFTLLFIIIHFVRGAIINKKDSIETKLKYAEFFYFLQLELVVLSFICALLILQICVWAK